MAARRPHTSARRRTDASRATSSRTSGRPSGHTSVHVPLGDPVDAAEFAALGVPERVCAALAGAGITDPFPIQRATLPDSMAGRDVLGRGKTGSGKTLAFVLPVLTRLSTSDTSRRSGRPRALILAPTRELASQIDDTLRPLAQVLGLRTTTVFGGVGHAPQIAAMRDGVDVVVACPGRLGDLIEGGHTQLDAVEITVLDEADHMADLGFLPVVKRLLDRTPERGQRMLFSATLDGGIDVLVKRYLHDPVTHSVDSAQSPVEAMEHHVLHIDAAHRLPVLVDLAAAPGRTMVFTRTKHRAKQLTRQLVAAGIPAVEMHGNLAQTARTRNLASFSDGRATTMVATDIAARGIHVDDISLVVHADPPVEHKAYLHRSGRTARAGAAGTVVTLMTDDQRSAVRDLTRKAGIDPVTTRLAPGHPMLEEIAPGPRVLVPVEDRPTPSTGASTGVSGRPGGNAGGPGRGAGRNGAPAARNGGQGGRGNGGGSGRGGATAARNGGPGGRSSSGRAGGGGRSGAGRSGGRAGGGGRGGGRGGR